MIPPSITKSIQATMGRRGGKPRKIPMELRQSPSSLSTSFTKRRQGLFSKVSQVCLLCDANVAAFASSPAKKSPPKFFSLGHPSVDSVLNDLTGRNPVPKLGDLISKRTAQHVLRLANPPVRKSAAGLNGLSNAIEEMVNGGGDLKVLVELLRKMKSTAEAKSGGRKQIIPQIGSSDLVAVGGSGGGDNDSVKLMSSGNEEQETNWMEVEDNYDIGSSSTNISLFSTVVPSWSCLRDAPIWSRFEGYSEGMLC